MQKKSWLEIYGDKKKKLWTAHSSLQLNHQIDCFHNFSQKSFGIGIKACEEGKNIVYGIRLKYPLIKNRIVRSKFVILGAGGGALSLLQKSGIPEGLPYAGFPVSGKWLICEEEKLTKIHNA